MGSEQSTTAIKSQQQYQSFMLQYSKEQDLFHQQFGQIKVYTHNQTGEMIMMRRFHTRSQQEFDSLQILLKKRKQLEQAQLIKMIAVKSNQDSNLCSDSSTVIAVYEYFQDTLLDELQTRFANGQQYSEGHIWILTQQIIDACAYLEERGLVHGDLRPENIFLDSNGSAKLAEYNMVPGGQPGFSKILTCKDKPYLSPALLQALKSNNLKPAHNIFRSDVFSLGMTLLHATLLQNQEDSYDYINGTIVLIEQKLKFVKRKGYSQVFINLLKELLQIEEDPRPTFTELKGFIDQYREQIYNLQPFYEPQQDYKPRMMISQAILSSPNRRIYQPVQQIVRPVVQQMVLSSPQRVMYSPIRMKNSQTFRESPSTFAPELESRVHRALLSSHHAIQKNI